MSKPSTELIAKHVAILKKLAAKGKGTLPSYTWLNAHGFFGSYDCVRQFAPGVLKGFKRAHRRTGPKPCAA
jgi:hypothetical protein